MKFVGYVPLLFIRFYIFWIPKAHINSECQHCLQLLFARVTAVFPQKHTPSRVPKEISQSDVTLSYNPVLKDGRHHDKDGTTWFDDKFIIKLPVIRTSLDAHAHTQIHTHTHTHISRERENVKCVETRKIQIALISAPTTSCVNKDNKWCRCLLEVQYYRPSM